MYILDGRDLACQCQGYRGKRIYGLQQYLIDIGRQDLINSSINDINIFYVNLPVGDYVFHLAIFDSAGERVLEERQFELIKEGEFYERPGFFIYMLLLLSTFLIWFTWLIVQRQLNQQQIKLNMANETVMAIANAVDAKDVRTHQHSMRVAEYAVLIAQELNCFKWWNKRKFSSNSR